MSTQSATDSFADLGLPTALQKALAKVGYETPSPIQARSIPPLLEGRDLIGQAQTGTGKTAAFALPILARLQPGGKLPRALVLCPTRELALQVAEAFQSYARYLKNFHVLPVYGGQDMHLQLRQLKRGVDVVVGTPGRLLDHLQRGSLNLSELQTVVLDEADEMLRMGFIDDVEKILGHSTSKHQTVLFSATLPQPILRVSKKFLSVPAHIKIQAKAATVDTIDQQYWLLNNNQKLDALTRLLETEPFDGVIVFTRTRGTTVELAEKISARGYACAPINGDMSQSVREQTIQRLKKSKIDILVATDVAARGLDVDRISLVVNYDIPYDAESYIHRVGRTARAGREGRAVLFITHRERRLLRSIEKASGKEIPPIRLPSAEEVLAKRVQRFKQDVIASLAEPVSPLLVSLVDELCVETGTSPQALAASLVKLLQRDLPLELPAGLDKKSAKTRDRGKREDRKPRKSRGKKSADAVDVEMESFRLEVGRQHEVSAGNIVGAIANEIDIDSQYIGHIDIHEDYSTVELPSGMPKELFQHLKKVRVLGRPLDISRLDKAAGRSGKPGKFSRKKPGGDKAPGAKRKRSVDGKKARSTRKRQE
ncbi:MAG: DEAD/DEAH box helicase [Gammaproteobacteria bacterium]|nr:DEAD/DEAH box helicase [Gammaproteobacteria bacterium]